jgi:hypothetical protein
MKQCFASWLSPSYPHHVDDEILVAPSSCWFRSGAFASLRHSHFLTRACVRVSVSL